MRVTIELARRVVFDLLEAEASVVAGVRALRPNKTVSRPEIPPIEASLLGASNRIMGPKNTTTVATSQPIIAITNQALARAHHSRSSSSIVRPALDRPTKSAHPKHTTAKKRGPPHNAK